MVFYLLEQNNKEVLVRFLEYKTWRKKIAKGTIFTLVSAKILKPLSLLLLPLLLGHSLTLKTFISFLAYYFSQAFSFFFSLSLSPRFFFRDFGKEKQKWELKGQKLIYT